ncbi:MAG: hypothetical protein KDN22_32020 [Verrucomicrobiae bacterium]|nr:hypothetical protein [Verrucomicrobiae bacterium]
MNDNRELTPVDRDTAKDATSRTRQVMPGLGLAIGVFIGNLLFVSIRSGDLAKGIIAGTAAGLLVILVYQVVPSLRAAK